MASIYSFDGTTITEGIQGCSASDQAINAARDIAKERDEDVLLVDDDGEWIVRPDGTCDAHDSAETSDKVRYHRGDNDHDAGWYPVLDGSVYWTGGPYETAREALEAARDD